MSGTVFYEINYTLDGQGGLHMEGTYGPRNAVSGVGLTSGTRYEAKGGVTHLGVNSNSAGLPYESTNLNEVQFIASGSGDKVFRRDLWRVTIDANGDIHAEITKSSVVCR